MENIPTIDRVSMSFRLRFTNHETRHSRVTPGYNRPHKSFHVFLEESISVGFVLEPVEFRPGFAIGFAVTYNVKLQAVKFHVLESAQDFAQGHISFCTVNPVYNVSPVHGNVLLCNNMGIVTHV